MKWTKFVLYFVVALLVFQISSSIICKLYYPLFYIPSCSMEPTLMGRRVNTVTKKVESVGDRIVVDKAHYSFNSLHRGDIIVFRYPDGDPSNPPRDFIKRLIGLPGDHIKIASGALHINGKEMIESYVKEAAITDFETTVPATGVFVLGDNRNNSPDSRYWGFVPIENVIGVAFYRYFPFERAGPLPQEYPVEK